MAASNQKGVLVPSANGNKEQTHPFISQRSGGKPSDMLCGLGPFKPSVLQCFVRMSAFTGVYSLSGLMTSILSVYIMSQITTIEKQFGLSSSQSGLLLSCNDIGFLLTTMFFSYIARKVHIPRFLWLACMLYGIAGLLCSIPYFLSRDYILKQTEELIHGGVENRTSDGVSRSNTPMCRVGDGVVSYSTKPKNTSLSTCDATDTDSYGIGKPNEYTQITIIIIAIGMVIQGIGKAPRFPFITTYVDDNGQKKDTAMYMGIISGVGIFGPAIGFSVGGLFSRTHVTLEDIPLSPRHPAWIGAWWVGFIIFGLMAMTISFPLIFFPKRMRPRPVAEPQHTPGTRKLTETIYGFLKSLARLLKNSVYVSMLAATCILLFGVAGMLAFSAKYLETQFFIPAWQANILLGVMSVVSASAGTVIGGLVVTKRKLSPLSCVKMILVTTSLTILISVLGFFLGCSNADIAGYNMENNFDGTNTSCSTACGCDSVTYFPVCGSNNINFMSPCHAGCSSQKGMEFMNCTCVGENGTATAGLCETGCNMLYPFLVFNVVGSFLATLAMIPGFIVQIRSVSEADKPMAVGLASLLSTLCGWFAGPVAFGKLVDTTCQLWSSSCSGGGACALYDNDSLRFRKHTFEIIPRAVALLFYVFVYFRARVKTDWSTDQPRDHAATSVDVDGDVKQSMIKEDNSNMATSPTDWNKSPIYKGDKPFSNRTFAV